MTRARRTPATVLWWLVFALLAGGMFVAAINGDIYNATSPPALAWHLVLRKLYSVIAFAAVGAAYAQARGGARTLDAAIAIALYSGAIEIGQWFVAVEPLRWNVGDVLFGAAGGALGAVARRAAVRLLRR